MKKILVQIVLLLVIIQVAYLALVNLALNLPLTQSLINQHRPEKYAVHWDWAWSWSPLKIHATGISANGQTSSQQWQADVSAASATVAIAPLFRKTVQIEGVQVRDVGFRLRPRPKPEKEYRAIREFFPPIEAWDPDAQAAARHPPKKGDGWTILVDGIDAKGSHDLWVFQIRALLEGSLRGSAAYQTIGGPVSVSAAETDILLKSLTINRDWEVSSNGSLKSRFDIAPFVPAENPGIKTLGFLTLDTELDTSVNSLRFLDFYLREFSGMQIDGKGRLQGHLKYEHENLMPGTDLAIEASELALSATPYEVKGAGGVDISVAAEDPQTLSLGILFGALEAKHRDDQASLFAGTGLEVRARSTARVLPNEERTSGQGSLAVIIPSVQVPDLRLYQRYIPAKWDVELQGGQGALQGEAKYSASEMSAEFYLASGDTDLRLKDFRFDTNLDLGLRARAGVAESASIDLSGTYLRLVRARLATTEERESEPWQASWAISEGTLGIRVPEGDTGESGFTHLSDVFKERGLKALLASADAQLKANLAVSDLGWVNLLFPNPFELSIAGSGTISTDLRIHEGWVAEGTAMQIEPEGLEIRFLDYEAQGKGLVALMVERGGERPDMRLDARLSGARLKRSGERDAVVEEVALEVSAVATEVTVDGGGEVAALDLRIPSAQVKDMSVYNQYLPKDAPLKLLGGKADLTAEVHLEPESAVGFVKLKTRGLRSRLDEQEIAGELTLNVKLSDGVPKDMRFDISGSSLTLDRFKVAGGQKSVDRQDWYARFDLRKAHVVWTKPVRLDLQAGIEMKDSRPIVAMFANQRGKNSWLDKVLTVEGVRGKAELKVASERALLPFALVGSDRIDVGAKGLVDKSKREGIFYARYSKLHGILKVKDGDKNFDILGAREKFDSYVPGETPLRLSSSQPKPTEETPETETSAVEKPRPKKTERVDPGRGRNSYEIFMGE
jgi:hypothetical protein